jgi:hypothetical protein
MSALWAFLKHLAGDIDKLPTGNPFWKAQRYF